jgi:TonB-linked SusC/RagA family outer membrane protein
MQTDLYVRKRALCRVRGQAVEPGGRIAAGTRFGIAGLLALSLCCAAAPGVAAHEAPAPGAAFFLKEVKGRVLSADGQPVIGVTVTVAGQKRGALTDVNGQFSVQANAGEKLEFSMIGFKRTAVTVGEGNTIPDVLMEVDVQLQNEVVVVGYGTQKKVNITGAVTHIKAEEIENRMAPNLASTLQGIAPNLNVVVGNGGGEPGAAPDINVRGTGSLSGGGPLILVDGIQQDINTVSPSDVESISVLKDASASALYGVRAAFGVILITTKRGGNSKPRISYNGNYALTRPTTLPDVVSSVEFATAVNESYANAGQAAYYTKEHIGLMQQYMANPGSLPTTMPNPANPANWGPVYANVNAYDVFYKDFGNNQQHNLSVSGGNQAVNYFLSGSYYNQGSQWRYGSEKYNRYTVTSNISAKVAPWMRAGLNTKFTRTLTDMPHTYPDIGNFYHDIPRRWPINPEFDANGHPYTSTLALMMYGGRDVSQLNQLVNSFNTEIEPVKGFKINADFNMRLNMAGRQDHTKSVTRYNANNSPYIDGYSAPNGYLSQNSITNFTSANIYTSYEKSLRKHYFKVMGGFQSEYYKTESSSATRNQLITDRVPFITLATGDVILGGSKSHWATAGFFGRFNYSYDDKLMFEFSNRYDGTSKFQSGKRWGYFPSFSAGYNIARENFWKDLVPQVSMFKLRTSYGTLGNQNVSGDYAYIANMGSNSQLSWIMGDERPLYITPQGLVTPSVTWEKATTLNFGLDVAAFNNRLAFELDMYERRTDNMFGPAEAVPAILGTGAPRRNNATLSTKGWEVTLGWKDRVGEVNYRARLVLSDYKSTVLKYRNPSGSISTHYEGKVIGEIWGYVTEGLFQSQEEIDKGPDQSFFYAAWRPGDVHYRDLNGDGKINAGASTITDPGDQAVIGNLTPRLSYGVSLGAEYKGFSIDVFIQGVGKRDIWLESNFFWGITGNINQSTIFREHLNYWREGNEGAYFAKPYMNSEINKNIKRQSRFMQNAAYTRLKNLQFGYEIPARIAGKAGMSKVRVYFTGENLLTFTNLIGTFDPEATGGGYGQGKIYPLAQMYSLGINMNLK